jgi:uncharacterized protein YbjT (DUF2867 family)
VEKKLDFPVRKAHFAPKDGRPTMENRFRKQNPVLVTGATGYVGGRLVPQLLASGYRLRVVGRSLSKLRCRPWGGHPKVELAQGDVLDAPSLARALEQCWASFYLVHSMNPQTKDFSKTDRAAAQNMVKAASAAGLDRIIYLGGLGMDDARLSKHLRSRIEVARILQSGPVPATFLRAAMILGSGSASFEILRYLVERLPVMTTPNWVRTPAQPIAIRNVLHYLQGCLEHDEVKGKTLDIGGPDVVTYRELMEIYADEAGLPKRWIIPVPVLTPRLSAYWIHLVTPVPAAIARPLTEGLRNPVVCQENAIRSIIPQQLLSCREAIRLALERVKQERIDTCWSDAGAPPAPEWTYCGDASYAGGTILESGYRALVKGTPEGLWKNVKGIGGSRGWYFADALWRLRGLTDRMIGGVGSRRGRRHPDELFPGDALDSWRVLEVEDQRRLLLLSEMKLPGEALLEFQIHPAGENHTEILQRSRFLPRGIFGLVYWYALLPFHHWIFKGMARKIAQASGKVLLEKPGMFAPGRHNGCTFDPRKSQGKSLSEPSDGQDIRPDP